MDIGSSTNSQQASMLHINLRKATIDDRLNELFAIVQEFRQNKWNDELSNSLRGWALSLIQRGRPDLIQRLTEEELRSAAIERIDFLRTHVLFNPLNPSQTLVDPVLEREWSWEKECLKEWKRIDPHPDIPDSPFDGKHMEEEKPHSFAHAILVWAQSIHPEELEDDHLPSEPTISDRSLEQLYKTRAIDYRLSSIHKKYQQQVSDLNQWLSNIFEQTMENHNRFMNRIEEAGQIERERRLEALRAEQKLWSEIQEQKRRIASLEHDSAEQQQNLNRLMNELQQLREQYYQRCREVAQLREQLNDDGGCCIQ